MDFRFVHIRCPTSNSSQQSLSQGNFIRAKHVVGCNDDERHISDGVVGLLSFDLVIFEFVDVIGYSLSFEMVTLHLVL